MKKKEGQKRCLDYACSHWFMSSFICGKIYIQSSYLAFRHAAEGGHYQNKLELSSYANSRTQN